MSVSKGIKELVAEAKAQIENLSVEQAKARREEPGTLFVDIRDIRELERDGTIPGAYHAPRGMLEFWVDPASPYHKDVFAGDDKKFVLYCASGWRSALATRALKDMGMDNVAHIEGGFSTWRDRGGEVTQEVPGRPRS